MIALADEERTRPRLARPSMKQLVAAGLFTVLAVYMASIVPTVEIAWVSAIQGFGTALMWTPIVLIGFSGLSPSQMAQGAALFHLIRQLSMSVFLAVMVGVSIRTGTISYAELAGQLDLFVPGSLPSSPWDFESTSGLAELSAEVARQSKMIGYNNAFLL